MDAEYAETQSMLSDCRGNKSGTGVLLHHPYTIGLTAQLLGKLRHTALEEGSKCKSANSEIVIWKFRR